MAYFPGEPSFLLVFLLHFLQKGTWNGQDVLPAISVSTVRNRALAETSGLPHSVFVHHQSANAGGIATFMPALAPLPILHVECNVQCRSLIK